jgi:hypothetical protein
MTELKNYQEDGANYQAKAVLAFTQRESNIEKSWDAEQKRYKAEPRVARWENCREQGYIISLKTEDYSKQLNIVFFEHRNSDSICAVKWEQSAMNTITIENAQFGDVYKDKYDTSFSVGYGEVVKMADWITKELNDFWITNLKEKQNA